MVFDQDNRSIINFKGNNVYFETLNSNTITISQKLIVHDSIDVTNTLKLESLKIDSGNNTVILKAPPNVSGLGDILYTLPLDVEANGKYLRYKDGGILEWAQLNSDKIYTDNATISIANDSTISMSTSGTDRLTILSDGNVGIGTTEPVYKLHVEGDTYLSTLEISNLKLDQFSDYDYDYDTTIQLPILSQYCWFSNVKYITKQ